MATTFKPRPTVYKGVGMRSRLEAGFAAWLDNHRIEWEYEPCAFGSPDGQYLPDFRVLGSLAGREKVVYIECKPAAPDRVEMDLEDYLYVHNNEHDPLALRAIVRRLAVIFASEPDAVPVLVWPRMQSYLAPHSPTFLTVRPIAPGYERADRPAIALPATAVSGPVGGLHLAYPHMGDSWPSGYWNVA